MYIAFAPQSGSCTDHHLTWVSRTPEALDKACTDRFPSLHTVYMPLFCRIIIYQAICTYIHNAAFKFLTIYPYTTKKKKVRFPANFSQKTWGFSPPKLKAILRTLTHHSFNWMKGQAGQRGDNSKEEYENFSGQEPVFKELQSIYRQNYNLATGSCNRELGPYTATG